MQIGPKCRGRFLFFLFFYFYFYFYFYIEISTIKLKARLHWRFLLRFGGDFTAITSRPCKLLAIPRRFELPVVYTNRPEIALEIAAKIASVNGP